MFAKILVCLDGSSLAEQILPYANEQAIRFGSKLVLLQAVTISSTIAAAATPGAEDILVDEFRRETAEAKVYLESVAQPTREKGLDVECVVMEGLPGRIIVNYADKSGIELIAIATHGRSGIKRLVFGSVVDYVLKESVLPILVVKPRETKK